VWLRQVSYPANDISGRKWQGNLQSNQWTFAKSFDTWCPIGPQLVSSSLLDSSKLGLRTTLNGKQMQDANTSDLIFGVDKIVSFLSQGTTIEAGTVILTGTPSVSFLLPFGVYFRQPF
jgi:2-keto-4-pentenoate hydratase/2-oxohepta-3-ene-1,7-dioic acid hydratase in catechol pathway